MAVATAFLKRTYPEFWSEYVRWEPTQRLKRIQEVSNLLAEIQAQQAAIDQIRNPKDDAADRARFNLEAKPHFDKITDCFRQMTRPLQP